MIAESLKKLGLSEGEIKVYSSLLDNGSLPINSIHERTGIERRNIYDILNKLIEKGLVSYINENKRRSFQVSSPNKIISYICEKKDYLEEIKQEVDKEMQVLMDKFKLKRANINAEIFRGYEGIKAIWEDMLNYDNLYWIGSGRYIPKKFPNFFENWNKRRIKKKIMLFNLMRHELREQTKKMPMEELKFLPKEFSANPTVICIYGDKVVNFLFGEDIFAFLIESKDLAHNYRIYYKYLLEKVAKE
ncbi:MAG: helix-turn-helix domain-containing protein [Nanoarchaeota archaeon]